MRIPGFRGREGAPARAGKTRERRMLNTVTNVDKSSPVRRHVHAGDALVSINGHEIEDVLDYRYWSYESRLTLLIRRPDGSEHTVKVRKEEGADLGLDFAEYLMDKPWVRVARGVHLVHAEHDGLAGALEHIGDGLVRGGDAGAYLGDEDDDVRRVYGEQGLLAHEQENFAVGARLYAAGVDYVEFPPVPLALGVQPVARDARRVLDNREPAPGEAVEEHGLADVRPAHYCYEGSGHCGTSK